MSEITVQQDKTRIIIDEIFRIVIITHSILYEDNYDLIHLTYEFATNRNHICNLHITDAKSFQLGPP